MAELTLLDKVLNIVIPLMAIFFFGMVFYKNLREPFDKLFSAIKGLFTRGKDKIKDKKEEMWDDDETGYIPRL